MGTWEIALSSSDTYSDIYSEYYNQFNSNVSPESILQNIESQFSDVLLDEDEKHEFVFAVVKATWEIGRISSKYLAELKNIIDDKSEINRWLRLGGTKKDADKRQQNIIALYEKVIVENTKPKKIKRIKLIDAYFDKGDCIAFRDIEGNYTAIVILSKEIQTEYGLNLALVLDYFSKSKPQISDFENANCAMTHDVKGGHKPWTQYCYAKDIKKLEVEFEIIGKIKISIDYPYQGVGNSFGSWNLIPNWTRERNDKNKVIPSTVKAKKLFRKGLFG